MSDIKTPDCPECGQPPASTLFFPYFCRTDNCKVMHWNPENTLAEIRAAEPHVYEDFLGESDENKS